MKRSGFLALLAAALGLRAGSRPKVAPTDQAKLNNFADHYNRYAIALATFDLLRTQILPGDVIVFGGNDRAGLLQIPGEILAGGIQGITDSVLSHSAMVVDPQFPGCEGTGPWIIESTIHGEQDGVQVHPLEDRLREYDADGSAWWLPLSSRFRKFLDFDAIWALAARKVNQDTYNVWEILWYLLRHMPGVQEVPQLYQSANGSEVCSELVALLLQAGGIPGLRPATMPPQALAELRIYRDQVQLLGKPQTIARFNSV